MSNNIFFSADHHLFHANVIKYSKRPFQSVEEMNESLIQNWNSVVKPGDLIYHLGDFSFGPTDKTQSIIDRLAGNKYLILGNHDEKKAHHYKGFIWMKDTCLIKPYNQYIFLCHYALRTWNKSHKGSYQLHGHSHGTLPRLPGYKQLDVGVDCWNYTPVYFEQIKAEMDKIEFVPVDHHGRMEED